MTAQYVQISGCHFLRQSVSLGGIVNIHHVTGLYIAVVRIIPWKGGLPVKSTLFVLLNRNLGFQYVAAESLGKALLCMYQDYVSAVSILFIRSAVSLSSLSPLANLIGHQQQHRNSHGSSILLAAVGDVEENDPLFPPASSFIKCANFPHYSQFTSIRESLPSAARSFFISSWVDVRVHSDSIVF